jgi:hypothetical protein
LSLKSELACLKAAHWESAFGQDSADGANPSASSLGNLLVNRLVWVGCFLGELQTMISARNPLERAARVLSDKF